MKLLVNEETTNKAIAFIFLTKSFCQENRKTSGNLLSRGIFITSRKTYACKYKTEELEFFLLLLRI